MSDVSDGRRLEGRGFNVDLVHPATGDVVDFEIRFRSRHLSRFEDDYGSLDALAEALKVKPVGTVAYVVGVLMSQSKDQAVDWLDSTRISKYIEAIGQAFELALGSTDAKSGNGLPASASASPGAGSTGSPSSATASTPSGSGT